MTKDDICYRDAPGSIVTSDELNRFAEYKECPECHSKLLLLGLLFGVIATNVYVVCVNCKWKCNITNVDNW